MTKTMPTPIHSGSTSGSPSRVASAAKKRPEIGTSSPAPSPVLASDATAPRWRTLQSALMAVSTIARLDRPSASATKPMPQASRSIRGSQPIKGLFFLGKIEKAPQFGAPLLVVERWYQCYRRVTSVFSSFPRV